MSEAEGKLDFLDREAGLVTYAALVLLVCAYLAHWVLNITVIAMLFKFRFKFCLFDVSLAQLS